MLQFIFGTSGCGKSYKIREIIKEKVFKSNKKLMLIVPEQYSFENEREMLKVIGADNLNKVEVMSFTRLTNLVFRTVGGLAGVRIDDAIRNVLMSLAIEESKDRLSLYKEDYLSENLVDIMISALKEFKMCLVSTDDLFNMSKEIGDQILSQKLKETALILSVYDSLLTQNYIDPLDDLGWLYSAIRDNNFFKDYIVFIDAFNGFTMQEIKIIESILLQTSECYITACIDDLSGMSNELSLFSPVYKMVDEIIKIAKKNDVKINPYIKLVDQKRFRSNTLKIIEKNVYRVECESLNKKINDVILYSASNLYSECLFVSNTIKRLVIEQNYNYRDFAVISRTSETYRGIIDSIFKKNKIPYFLDKPEPIDSKPIIKFVITAFEIINSSYSSELIFKYLKTGLTTLNIEEISVLENYVFLWNIKGKKWKEEFKFNPNGFSEKNSIENKNLLLEINIIKDKIIKPLDEFEKSVDGKKTGIEISKAVYTLLNSNDVHKNLFDIYIRLNKNLNVTLAREQLRLWDLFIDILDEMAAVLKNKYLLSKRYLELLRLIIKSNDISFIPQGIDQVTIGDADRIRLRSPKIVFLIGAVEGEFPRTPVPFGVFSDIERKLLISKGITMYNSLEKLAIEERFLAYLSISSASEKLYVSWPSSDIKGTSKKPSSIVKEIKRVIPTIKTEDEFSMCIDESDMIWSEDSAFEICAKRYRDESRFSNTLKYYFKNNKTYKTKLDALNKISEGDSFKFTDEKKAKKLFGEELKLSASQVENFYLCKFEYFCKYGLNAKPRKQASFDSLEYGLVMHYLLENILKKYDRNSFCNITRKQAKEEVNFFLNEYLNLKLGGMEDKSPRFKYLFFRLIKTAERLILHLSKEFMQSEFYPDGYEVSVEDGGDIDPLCVKLSDGNYVKVRGKIDRLDLMNKNGKTYIRIVDYKTGTKEFKLSDVLYGLNMQMLIYLTAVWKNGNKKYKNIVPSGILYMPSSIGSVNLEKGTPKEKIDKEQMKILKMNGLVLDDPLIIRGMEQDASGVFIPVSLKDGKPSKKDSVITLSEMGKISKHVESLIEAMAESLYKGDISFNPVSGEYDSCKWCEYSSVCGYEKGSKTEIIEKLDKTYVIEELTRKYGETDGK